MNSKFLRKKNAQTSIEYLLILAGVILIVVIVGLLLKNIAQSSGTAVFCQEHPNDQKCIALPSVPSPSVTCNDNGTCDTPVENTSNCPTDCPTPAVSCNNDGICDTPPEDSSNCPNDCPTPTSSVSCNNDGFCDSGETYADCPSDNCPP